MQSSVPAAAAYDKKREGFFMVEILYVALKRGDNILIPNFQYPPSTCSSAPFMNDDFSLAKNNAALLTSSGLPIRRTGVLSTMRISASGGRDRSFR